MAKLQDRFILDLTGGMRNDKSDYRKLSNESVVIRNYIIDRSGRLCKRLGSHQLGQTISADDFENMFYFERLVAGATPDAFFVANTRNSGATIKRLIGSRNTSALTTASTSITLDDASDFLNTGDDDAEIEGDLFNYTGITSNTLTGVTGLSFAHDANTAVNQWINLDTDTFDGRKGISYAVLNNLLYVQANDGAALTFDGSTFSAVTGEPNARFATAYRQRIYATQYTSTSNARVFFSNAGDPTTWTGTDFFDVEGERGELITSFKDYNDELLIFKTNSFFAYNETTLKLRNNIYGAYNHKVTKEINGLMYSFCPEGIFVTNGHSVTKISDPVKDWIRDFRPIKDTLSNTIVENTFAAVFDEKYVLYIGDVTTPGTFKDVALVYDTQLKNWSVFTGLTNFQYLGGFNAYNYGGAIQGLLSLFGGDSAGKAYRFFSKSYVDTDNNARFVGPSGHIFEDLISDTGVLVSSEVHTKLYDFGATSLKQVGYIRVLAESPGLFASFRVETEKGLVSDWISLGEVDKRNKRFRLPTHIKGYRYAVNITHSDRNIAPVLNGITFEDIELLDDKR